MQSTNTIHFTTLSPTVVSVAPRGFPWQTIDTFLFCLHHDEAYPAGNAQMEPAAPLSGRNPDQNFSRKDEWSIPVTNDFIHAESEIILFPYQ
jgi:hypothetical protein